jgi:hypothetical protein
MRVSLEMAHQASQVEDMYYIGMVGCPHCEYRERICVEAAYPLPNGEFVEVCCPNDGSRHRCSLSHMQPVELCPPELKPVPSGPRKACEATVRLPDTTRLTAHGWRALVVIWLCVAVGAGIIAAFMLTHGTPQDWIEH